MNTCCIVLIAVSLIVCIAVGVPCVYLAYKCKTAELRESNSALCRHIHSDDAAKTVEGFGYFLSVPWIALVAFLCVSKVTQLCLELGTVGMGD